MHQIPITTRTHPLQIEEYISQRRILQTTKTKNKRNKSQTTRKKNPLKPPKNRPCSVVKIFLTSRIIVNHFEINYL